MKIFKSIILLSGLALANTAFAIPALQLGEGSTGDWSYDAATETWVVDGSGDFSMMATANYDGSGGNGSYAWDAGDAGAQTAYLVAAAVPDSNIDAFDISISNDGGLLSMYTSGYGAPPIEDPNSIAGHGIYDTYFEIYQFNYDGAVTNISDTQPGGTGTGLGFIESFNISINSLVDGAHGVHFDLFTVSGDGILDLGTSDRQTVNAFAPFSHDAEAVPEPATLALMGLGLVGLGLSRRRRKS